MLSGSYSSRSQNTDPPPATSGHSRRVNDDTLWSAFASAQTAADFCGSWLSLQCIQITDVRAALLLLEQSGGTFVPAAVWPGQEMQHDTSPHRVILAGKPVMTQCASLILSLIHI